MKDCTYLAFFSLINNIFNFHHFNFVFYSGIHYYWNTNDDTVSWLPPSHPKSVVSKSAAVLRKEIEATQPEEDENDENTNQNAMEGVEMDYNSDSNQSNSIKEPPIIKPPPISIKKSRARDLEKVLRSKSERRMKKDANEGALDPMDPASYSDIPR